MPPFDPVKHPISQSLNWFSEEKIADAQKLLAKSYPCSVEEVIGKTNSIVKVKIELRTDLNFPVLTVPVASPQYVRFPIKKGDKGVVFCVDYGIWGVTGLGTTDAPADLSAQFNSSNGVFFPVGSKKFDDVKEGEDKKVVIYGPDGAVLRTAKGDKGKVDVSDKGVVIYSTTGDDKGNYLKMTEAGFEFYVNGSLKCIIDGAGMRMIGGPRVGGGNYGVTITDHGTQIDNFNWLNHVHQGVQPGAGNSQKINETVSPP